ncbi:unnamed protein product [Microthlaspi erraticum]|uniref:Uncharacterized protein n=1 Tax=Microthlaspi erraticum TaxID=1685480 RepID=A0A6D2IPJ4_9BRAS|nr:unnamed protein product [Microthlaspi erraticum]
MGESVRLRRSQTCVDSSSEKDTTDAGLSGKDESDSYDSETESNRSSDSETESNRSSDSTTTKGLTAIIRVLSDSMLRTEMAEMEMIKAREAARWEAEKKRLETELEMTRMVLQTHLEVTTSLLSGEQKFPQSWRKRKRSEVVEHESSTTRGKRLALLGLLQLNLIFWNSLT